MAKAGSFIKKSTPIQRREAAARRRLRQSGFLLRKREYAYLITNERNILVKEADTLAEVERFINNVFEVALVRA